MEGMKSGGVTTLSADALMYDRSHARELDVQREVAFALLRFSPQVAVREEETIVIDVTASLRLFGGIVHVWEADAARAVQLHQPRSSAHAGYHQNIGESMYIAEVGSFLAAATGRGSYPHSLDEDIRVLELLEAIEA